MAALPAAVALASLGGDTMGTRWSARVVAPARANLHRLHAGIERELDVVVRQMSTWETDSDISRFNRGATGEWFALPDAFRSVLACAMEIAEASDGAFDPTIGSLVGLWGFGADPRAQGDADAQALADARRSIGWRRLVFDAASGRAQQPGGVRLDLSAIAKGHAVDRVIDHLRGTGIAHALVEVGGELRGVGRKPDGSAWHVLVETGAEETDSDAEPRVLKLDDVAVATSGDRWHQYTHDGARHSHTIDPRSGVPVAARDAAVTVLARDAMHADAWATAMTVLGEDAGIALAERKGLAVRFLASTLEGPSERMTQAFRAHLLA